MASVLLTGAGFSRNWGGWLTTEAFEYLLGRPEINPRLRNILWACNGNFESALQEVRGRAQSGQDDSASDDLSRFNAMLSAMFESMKMGYRRTPLETDQVASAIRTDRFLSEFDAIFTLNQDTLLEQHYMYQPAHEATHGRWQGVEVPGLEEPSPVVQHGNQLEKAAPRKALTSGFSLREQYQPYIKLHGSSNWLTDNGYLLIMGGNKNTAINDVPLLTWYHTLFRQQICLPDTRLMIIGYSFFDDHINEHLFAAARAGTRLFIIDPLGVDVIDKRDGITRHREPAMPLMEKLRDNIVGASRRPLRITLHSDQVELRKLLSFMGMKLKLD